MTRVVIIGAGPAGITAALKASENNHVILIERNDKIGKKLALTGNGRCNYWNDSITKEKYNTDDYNKLSNILNSKDDTYDFLCKIGLYPKVKNGLYYPYSNQAINVCELFARKLEKSDIELKLNTYVDSIVKTDNEYLIKTNNSIIKADKLILAMGSKALSKTGSDGHVYDILSDYVIKVNKVLPALVPLNSDIDCTRLWNGVRCDVKLTLNDIEEEGEIQFTDYGISGICVFNLSSKVAKLLDNNKQAIIKINFLPFIDNYDLFMENRNNLMNNPTIEDMFESIINYKILYIIYKKSGINPKAHYNSLTESEKNTLKKLLLAFEVSITSTLPYEKAQVCTGGVSLTEINDYMELNKVPNLFIIGETLDVDGMCGGFNLAFAFITGFIVGSRI